MPAAAVMAAISSHSEGGQYNRFTNTIATHATRVGHPDRPRRTSMVNHASQRPIIQATEPGNASREAITAAVARNARDVPRKICRPAFRGARSAGSPHVRCVATNSALF
jgi:hypothetical protein